MVYGLAVPEVQAVQIKMKVKDGPLNGAGAPTAPGHSEFVVAHSGRYAADIQIQLENHGGIYKISKGLDHRVTWLNGINVLVVWVQHGVFDHRMQEKGRALEASCTIVVMPNSKDGVWELPMAAEAL